MISGNPGDRSLGPLAALILCATLAVAAAWPTILALALAQIATLLIGLQQFRWLPLELLALAWAYATLRLFFAAP